MIIQRGNVPEIPGFQPEAEGLRTIRGPKASLSLPLAGLTGLLLICPLMALSQVFSYLAIPAQEAAPASPPNGHWGAVTLTLLLFIPLHELMHLVCHPRLGLSERSILVVWPGKLRFGVYYEGCMSRTRWLIMRLLPFAVLSLLPACFLEVFRNVAFNEFLRTALEVLMVINGVGSGADAAAVLLVLFQVPAAARMCFRGGRAFWQPAAEAGSAAPG